MQRRPNAAALSPRAANGEVRAHRAPPATSRRKRADRPAPGGDRNTGWPFHRGWDAGYGLFSGGRRDGDRLGHRGSWLVTVRPNRFAAPSPIWVGAPALLL